MQLQNQGFNQALDQTKTKVASSANSMQAAFIRIGSAIAGAAIFKSIISIGIAAEDAKTAFNVILKDMAKTEDLLAKLDKFSVTTPFTPSEIRASGQALLAFRNKAEEIPEILQFLGDAAAATNAPLQDVVRIFNKAKSVGKLTGETFQQFAERGINLKDELSEAGESGAEFFKRMSRGEITFDQVVKGFRKMTGEGGIFMGGMIEKSKTLSGKISTLQGVIFALGEQVAKVVNTALKPMVDVAIKIGEKILALDKQMDGWITTVAAATMSVVGLKLAMLAAAAAGVTLSGALTMARLALKALIKATVILAAVGAVVGLLIKLGKVIATNSKVSAAWQQATLRLEAAWSRFRQAVETIWAALSEAWNKLATSIEEQWGATLVNVEDTMAGHVAHIISTISEGIMDISEWFLVIVENWSTVWELMVNTVKLSFIGIQDIVMQLPRFFAFGLGRVLRFAIEFGISFVEGFKGMINKAIDMFIWFAMKVIHIHNTLFESITTMLTNLVSNVANVVKDILAGKSIEMIIGDLFAHATTAAILELNQIGEAFHAGFGKQDIESFFQPSAGFKAALKENAELLAKLQEAKRALEERRGDLFADILASRTEEEKGKDKEKDKDKETDKLVAKNIELPKGFFGFQDLHKRLQEDLLETSDPAKKTAEHTGLIAASVVRQEEMLDTIADNTDPENNETNVANT
jgi:hypothetical protein